MKYCEEYAALLDPFVDGELPVEDMARVQAHLAVCPGCRAYVDDALALRAGFPKAEEAIVPDGFAEGVMERVRGSAGKIVELRRRAFRRRVASLTVLAACCALVILMRSGSDGASPSVSMAQDRGVAVSAYGGAVPEEAAEMNPENEEAALQMETDAASEAPKSRAAEPGEESKRVADANIQEDAMPFAALPAAASPQTAFDAAQEREPSLCLTAEEVGGLLDGFAPAWDSGGERGYELNTEEYRTLLEALGRTEELAEETGGLALVVVTGPSA